MLNHFIDIKIFYKLADENIPSFTEKHIYNGTHPIGEIPCMFRGYVDGARYKKNAESTDTTKEKQKFIDFENKDCTYDNGGYFIINGSEKVIVAQERQTENKLFIIKNKATDDNIIETEIRSMPHDKFQPARITKLCILKEKPSHRIINNPIRIVFGEIFNL